MNERERNLTMTDERLAAALRLEQELDRLIEGFAIEHAELVRTACATADDVTDLVPVVVTTVYGHVLSRLCKREGRERTEHMTQTLLEQFERAGRAEVREHVRMGPREDLH